MHDTPHPLAGQTVALRDGVHLAGKPVSHFTIVDWADRVLNQPVIAHILDEWPTKPDGLYPSLLYTARATVDELPNDGEVVYGRHADSVYAHLIHACEIKEQDQEQ